MPSSTSPGISKLRQTVEVPDIALEGFDPKAFRGGIGLAGERYSVVSVLVRWVVAYIVNIVVHVL